MKKILIVAPAWVGDAIMAQPLYRRLAARYPGVQIDVYAPAWTRPVHARMPEIHATIDNPFAHGSLRLLQRAGEGRRLRAQGYDQAIVLPNSFKSALVPWFAGIRTRTGWAREGRSLIMNDTRVLDPVALPQMVERFAALAQDANQPLQRPVEHPQLKVDDASRQAALNKLQLTADRPIVACCPGAEYGPAKRWPAVHFAALARMRMAMGEQVWLFGSKKDDEIASEIAALAPGAVNLCGQTSLAEAIDLMSLARVVVANDSGLMHVAAALDRPLVAIYGSSSPGFTPPLSHRAEIVTLDLDCSPCFERVCPLGHMNCLNQLEAPLANKAIEKLLLLGAHT